MRCTAILQYRYSGPTSSKAECGIIRIMLRITCYFLRLKYRYGKLESGQTMVSQYYIRYILQNVEGAYRGGGVKMFDYGIFDMPHNLIKNTKGNKEYSSNQSQNNKVMRDHKSITNDKVMKTISQLQNIKVVRTIYQLQNNKVMRTICQLLNNKEMRDHMSITKY